MRQGIPRGGRRRPRRRRAGDAADQSMAAWIGEVRNMLGECLTRRIGRTVIAVSAGLFLTGVTVFLVQSQTIGRTLIAFGAGLGLLFILFRRDPEAVLAGIRARRAVLISSGAVVVATGWAVHFAVSEIVGLLLVVLGALPLLVLLLGVKQDPLAGPLDGPPFGATGGS